MAMRKRSLSLIGAAFAIFLFWASLYVYTPILPTYTQSLGASPAQVGMVLGSYGLTQLLFRVPLGLLADRLGHKKLLALLGAFLVAVSGLGLGLSRTPTALFLSRAIGGGAAATWVVISVLYSDQFPIERAVRTSGQLSLLSTLGQIAAMTAGGFVADRWNARTTFWIGASLALPVALAFAAMRDSRGRHGTGITMSQFWRAISTPRLLLVSGLAACSQYALFGVSLGFIAVHAHSLGASDAQLGILTTAVQVAKAIPMLLLSLNHRPLSGRQLTIIGLALIAGPLFILPFFSRFALLVICQAIIGLGVGLVFPVLMGLSLQAVEPQARASAMGVYQSVYALGMTLGPAFSGAFARQWGITGVYVSNGVLLALAIIVATLFLRDVPPRTDKKSHVPVVSETPQRCKA